VHRREVRHELRPIGIPHHVAHLSRLSFNLVLGLLSWRVLIHKPFAKPVQAQIGGNAHRLPIGRAERSHIPHMVDHGCVVLLNLRTDPITQLEVVPLIDGVTVGILGRSHADVAIFENIWQEICLEILVARIITGTEDYTSGGIHLLVFSGLIAIDIATGHTVAILEELLKT